MPQNGTEKGTLHNRPCFCRKPELIYCPPTVAPPTLCPPCQQGAPCTIDNSSSRFSVGSHTSSKQPAQLNQVSHSAPGAWAHKSCTSSSPANKPLFAPTVSTVHTCVVTNKTFWSLITHCEGVGSSIPVFDRLLQPRTQQNLWKTLRPLKARQMPTLLAPLHRLLSLASEPLQEIPVLSFLSRRQPLPARAALLRRTPKEKRRLLMRNEQRRRPGMRRKWIMATPLALTAGFVSWHLVERPALDLRHRQSGARQVARHPAPGL